MGKCKKRTLYKSNTSYFMTREEAVSNIFRIFSKMPERHSKSSEKEYKKAIDTISLFGISAEELSEAGLPYENLMSLGWAIN